MKQNKRKHPISRREFLTGSCLSTAGIGLCFPMNGVIAGRRDKWQEARYYKKLDRNQIQCTLCPWQCVVSAGKRGYCDVRLNQDGTYYSLVYGQIATHHNDPIEKKPFYHFLPGSLAFSIATAGCNVECKYCQNWELAQRPVEEVYSVSLSPQKIVQAARETGCTSIAYTYNEPTIFTEFMIDIAAMGREKGIQSVVVSNGFINKRPLLDLCKVIDGYKVDLKAFSEECYKQVVHGRLAPVLDTLLVLKQEEVWTEIVYLIVPTLNDSDKELTEMVKWVYRELGPDVPVHFSRFYPMYKLKNLPPTPVSTLEKARNIGLDAGLHFVYMGNIPGHEGENTICPNCQEMVIGRIGYRISKNKIINGKCGFCGQTIAGVWEL